MHAPAAPSASPESAPEHDAQGRRIWKVGTLAYTAAGLVALFCWLLWGDFAWSMKERAMQPMSQLLFRQFEASNKLIALMVTALPAALGMLLVPFFGVLSDNHRGRWGRRIPYLVLTTPIAAGAMMGMGYTHELADVLAALLGEHAPGTMACRLITFSVLWTFFEIFTVIANAIFTSLINDVVPQAVIGRFFGLFRIVSLGAGIVFNSYLLGHAEENFKILFLALGALYGIGFLVMCFLVKEGDYPPPPPKQEGVFAQRVAKPVVDYFRECATHPFYLWIFLAAMVGNAAFLPINSFDMLYVKSIGMDLSHAGDLRSLTYKISIGLAFVIGWLADRFHPIRIGLVSLACYAVISLWAGLISHTVTTFSIAYVAHGVISGVFFTGTASLFPRLFPRAKFAQFASAAGIILAVGFIGIPYVVGWVLDHANAYHYTFVIGGGVAAVGALVFAYLYRQFNALGGMKAYTPPGA